MDDYISNLSSDILNQIVDHLDPPAIVVLYQTNKHFMNAMSEKHRQIMDVCKNSLNLSDKFTKACQQGYLFVAKWIYESIPPLLFNRSFFFDSALLELLIKRDNDSVFQWVCEHICDSVIFRHLFNKSCRYGKIDMARYIIDFDQKHHNIIDIHIDNEVAFRSVCEHGHLDMAKYLLEVGGKSNHLIDIHAEEDEAFVLACVNGHVNILEWLVSMKDKYGEIITEFSELFIQACDVDTGSIDTAKWLIDTYGQDINIHTDNDAPFYCACIGNDLELAKWLIWLGENGYGKVLINDNCWTAAQGEVYNFLRELRKRGY